MQNQKVNQIKVCYFATNLYDVIVQIQTVNQITIIISIVVHIVTALILLDTMIIIIIIISHLLKKSQTINKKMIIKVTLDKVIHVIICNLSGSSFTYSCVN